MNPLTNHMIQLQELVLIREEQKAAGEERHLQHLNESISVMTEELPPKVRIQFEKLRKRDQNIIIPMTEGGCSVCGLKLAISQVQQVRGKQELVACPNCTRYLYTAGEAPRQITKPRSRIDPVKVGIARFSSAVLMIPELEATDKEAAIREMAQRMGSEGYIDKEDLLIEEALGREAVLSTAVDHGLAFPHVRGVEGGGLTLALGLSTKGIKFDSKSSELTHIIFFLVIPTAASAFYLKLLAGLTETFMDDDNRQLMMDAKTSKALWAVLTKATKRCVK
jgi:mannitol/fructose-specific phosphotransferase system IIA component (Ntr-type)